MPQYKVKPGYTFGWRDDYQPGDVVELTEAEAGGFLDKLELVEDVPATEPSSEDVPAEDTPEPDAPAGDGEADQPAVTGKQRKG
jgi:hypothetical protein